MPRLSTVVKRHPLIAFFVLSYALSWSLGLIFYSVNHGFPALASFGPFLAALVVLAITQGKSGVVGLLRRMVRWRVGLRWYAVVLLPAGLAVATTVLNVMLGAQAPSPAELGGWTSLLPGFFLILLIPGLGGAWEEPGWRGYALPRLQSGRSALFASLILWVLISLWHLPLMVVGQVHYSDIVLMLAGVIIYNWVFNSANGSVLIIMLMHAVNNTVSGSFFSPMFSGADSVRQSWILAVVWCVVAIVVMVAGPKHLSRKHTKQEEPSEISPKPSVYEAQPQAEPQAPR